MKNALRAPMPYFGGKSRIASTVWDAFGRVQNYVEPFFGSGAVLLARPRSTWANADAPGTETVNDKSAFLANFWRAVQSDPDAVADACDWPVNETDLHARHRWLLAQVGDLAARLERDPTAFDARIAGWWCWGACAWIGTGWCLEDGREEPPIQLPHVSNGGMGVHRAGMRDVPIQLSHLGGNHDSGRGVHSKARRDSLHEYMHALAARLRGVRVACGDWQRICGDCVTWRHGTTAVFLDPPYAEGAQQYAAGGTGTGLSADVRAWAIKAGERRDMRVILCGLDGEHEMPPTWRVVEWKAQGGYGSQRADNANGNRHRERLWLSPFCCDDRQPSLFGGTT